ncbi:F-box/kelch-repeat protein-like [Iris pallida]|uniref:F-box/kelch-repeat protein-like n=1 Tax=Iris pallida TaxID=29817 RepID=A0AAX6HVQ0_IRIPA|nr:F-box/kelch-repeat protein-like [Iris pallida]
MQDSPMVVDYSFDKREKEKEAGDNKSEIMVDTRGCLFSQFSRSIDHDCGSFQKFLLAYMLLANDGSLLLKDVKENVFGKNIDTMPSLDHIGLNKKKYGFKSQQVRQRSDQRSNDCFLPGLHDDMALDCLAWASRSDYSSLASLNKKFNLLMGSGYLYKLRRQLGIIEHWVYVACSLMPWGAFDPFRQQWMTLPRMPCDECFSYADKESLAVGTQLLVFGRELTGFAIWMYSVVSRDWSRCPLMNLSRCLFGSGSKGGVAVVAGGVDKNGRVLKCAELYNSELGTWETLPDMRTPRKLCSGFFMDGKFYVIGGMSSHTDSLSCGEEYNLETRSWKPIPDMYPGYGNRATQSPPLVAVVNNQLYAADQSTNEVKKYDKANKTWNVVRTLPVRADSHNGWGLAFKACGDKLLVIGGHRGPQGEVIVLHYWCPEDGNKGRDDEWDVLSVRERAGAFVYNCAIMGC